MEPLGQHCTRFLPVQCCPKSIKTTLIKIFFLGNIVSSLLNNTAQGFYLFNVSLWLRYNFYEENNLCNAVLTMLGQHYIGILSSQCCLNTFETTLHQKTMFNVDQGRTNMFSKENKLYNVVLICLSQHFTRKLSLKYWPTVHKQLCT